MIAHVPSKNVLQITLDNRRVGNLFRISLRLDPEPGCILFNPIIIIQLNKEVCLCLSGSSIKQCFRLNDQLSLQNLKTTAITNFHTMYINITLPTSDETGEFRRRLQKKKNMGPVEESMNRKFMDLR